MIYRRRFVTLLSTVAAFLQLSPTIASLQECIDQSVGLPPGEAMSINRVLGSECPADTPMRGEDCSFDATSYSTNGDNNFTSTCAAAGGEVYDIDVSVNCAIFADEDGFTKITMNNIFLCTAKICTTNDVKTLWLQNFNDNFADCAYESFNVVEGPGGPAGSMALSVSTTLFFAVAVGTFSLVDIL